MQLVGLSQQAGWCLDVERANEVELSIPVGFVGKYKVIGESGHRSLFVAVAFGKCETELQLPGTEVAQLTAKQAKFRKKDVGSSSLVLPCDKAKHSSRLIKSILVVQQTGRIRMEVGSSK